MKFTNTNIIKLINGPAFALRSASIDSAAVAIKVEEERIVPMLSFVEAPAVGAAAEITAKCTSVT